VLVPARRPRGGRGAATSAAPMAASARRAAVGAAVPAGAGRLLTVNDAGCAARQRPGVPPVKYEGFDLCEVWVVQAAADGNLILAVEGGAAFRRMSQTWPELVASGRTSQGGTHCTSFARVHSRWLRSACTRGRGCAPPR
jgi:hypothetical protein